MIENTILAKNRQGKKAVTFAMTFPAVELVEYAAIAGFDAGANARGGTRRRI